MKIGKSRFEKYISKVKETVKKKSNARKGDGLAAPQITSHSRSCISESIYCQLAPGGYMYWFRLKKAFARLALYASSL